MSQAGCRHADARWTSHLTKALVLVVAFTITARAQAPFEVLHTFDGRADYGGPATSLTEGAPGTFYVTTARGGDYSRGAILKVTSGGAATVLHSFTGGADGSTPRGGLVRAANGRYYGTTEQGGVRGQGTIYSFGADEIVHPGPSLLGATGTLPQAGLTDGADGYLYGTTSRGGAHGNGTIFRTMGTGDITVVHAFTSVYGTSSWAGPLLRGSDESFYGVLNGNPQMLYRLDPTGTVGYVWYNAFSSNQLTGAVLERPDGWFVSASLQSPSGVASVSRYQRTALGPQTESLIYSFGPLDTGRIDALILEPDGALVGTTSRGGAFGHGTVFRIGTDDARTTLHDFEEGKPDALILASDGSYWGTTSSTGAGEGGTVFSIAPGGGFAVHHRFGDLRQGATPAPLVQGSDGRFYGTTFEGGAYGRGTVYALTSSGDFAVLHSFEGGFDGAGPLQGLIQARDGHFYGTTRLGGVRNEGTVFRMTAAGQVTVLHSFGSSPTDGLRPSTALVESVDGNVYGGTSAGGAYNRGTIFRVSPQGAVAVSNSFPDLPVMNGPTSLVFGVDGSLFGTAPTSCGYRIFRITPDGNFTILQTASLAAFPTSCVQLSGLIRGSDGHLYGSSSSGSGGGTFHQVTTSAEVIVFRRFASTEDGPMGPLTEASDGRFYYLARNGRVFSIARTGATSFYYASVPPFPFQNIFDPGAPTFLQAKDGQFYGTARPSGPLGAGIAYRLSLVTLAPTTVLTTTQGEGIRLRWTAVAGATSYVVRRARGTGPLAVIASGLAATEFLDTAVDSGLRYRYIVAAVGVLGESAGSYEASITPGRAVAGDFDGDARADVGVFRAAPMANWYIDPSTSHVGQAHTWGTTGDIPVIGDYDGDGRADRALFRPTTGAWYIIRSSSQVQVVHQWGSNGDVPVPGDYDGDTRTDVAVFRPATGAWFILQSSTGTSLQYTWGGSIDRPVAADYDGDGRTDIAVFRRSTFEWHILRSGTSTGATYTWGGGTDVPMPADFDGDGRADIAVVRPDAADYPPGGAWYILGSSTGASLSYRWGGGADMPVPADYDGDGRADVAIFRPSNGEWHVLRSDTGTSSAQRWGGSIDTPLTKRP